MIKVATMALRSEPTTTVKNVVTGDAPRVWAASGRCGSSRESGG